MIVEKPLIGVQKYLGTTCPDINEWSVNNGLFMVSDRQIGSAIGISARRAARVRSLLGILDTPIVNDWEFRADGVRGSTQRLLDEAQVTELLLTAIQIKKSAWRISNRYSSKIPEINK